MGNDPWPGEQGAPAQLPRPGEVYSSHTQGREEVCGVGISVEDGGEDGKISVASIYPCGAAAYSGQLAVGDTINAVDDTNVAGLTASQVCDLLLGMHGTLVRLSVSQKGADLIHVVWMLRFQRSWYSSLPDDLSLGILAETSEENTEFWEVTAISRGGGAWLGSFGWDSDGVPQHTNAYLCIGDVIESVNGQKNMTSVAAIKDAFTELPFSRTSVGIRRKKAVLTLYVIRTPHLQGVHLELCVGYINALTQALRDYRTSGQQSRKLFPDSQSQQATPEFAQAFRIQQGSAGVATTMPQRALPPSQGAPRQEVFREPIGISKAPTRSPQKSAEELMISDAMEAEGDKEHYEALLQLLSEWDRLQVLTKTTIKSIESSQSRAQSSASSVASLEGRSLSSISSSIDGRERPRVTQAS